MQSPEPTNVIQLSNYPSKTKLKEAHAILCAKPDPRLEAARRSDETLERLIDMNNQCCLVAIDKTMAATRRAEAGGFAPAAARVGSIAERITRAVHEVGMTLPPHQRA